MLTIYEAFIAALAADEPFPVYGWDSPALGRSPKPTRYLVVADFTPSAQNPRLSNFRGVGGHLFAVTVVAQTMTEVRAACDRMRDRLDGVRLTAGTGETSTTPLHQDEQNIQPVTVMDETDNPRLYTALELWRCASSRVPVA